MIIEAQTRGEQLLGEDFEESFNKYGNSMEVG